MKTCLGCNQSKALKEFGVRKAAKDGYQPRCKLCARKQNEGHVAKYLRKYPEKRRATQANWNRGKTKSGSNRKWRFGLSPEDIEDMLASQDGVCGLCRRDFSSGETFVDHDHACCPARGAKTCGRCTRKILCRACNQGLGLLQDDPTLLRLAADYIEAYRA